MHVGIVGTGVAGCALAWRLCQADPGLTVELLDDADPGRRPDATAASGGLVRGFEPGADACADATASLAELLDDPVLLRWSRFRRTGSVYLIAGPATARRAAAVEAAVPGSVRVLDVDAVREEYGFAGLPAGLVGVAESRAGHLSVGSLRDAMLGDLTARGVTRLGVPFDRLAAARPGAGPAGRLADGRAVRYDALVLAAGPWTPGLLARSGSPAPGWRTKAIQYAVHHATGTPPPPFVDESTGLYGRPAAAGRMLLGLPSDTWDVDPDDARPDEALARRVVAVAAGRLPALRLGGRTDLVAASDAYHDPPGLALRAVPGRPGVHTFSGGSGGAAKTVLAASRRAAALLRDGPAGPLVTAGPDRPPRTDREDHRERTGADAG